MYIVIRHSEAGSIILTRHDDFNAILEEMKLDMEYAYLKEYGGDIKLKDSDQFDDIGLTFRTKKPYDDRPLVTGYLNDIFNLLRKQKPKAITILLTSLMAFWVSLTLCRMPQKRMVLLRLL